MHDVETLIALSCFQIYLPTYLTGTSATSSSHTCGGEGFCSRKPQLMVAETCNGVPARPHGGKVPRIRLPVKVKAHRPEAKVPRFPVRLPVHAGWSRARALTKVNAFVAQHKPACSPRRAACRAPTIIPAPMLPLQQKHEQQRQQQRQALEQQHFGAQLDLDQIGSDCFESFFSELGGRGRFMSNRRNYDFGLVLDMASDINHMNVLVADLQHLQ